MLNKQGSDYRAIFEKIGKLPRLGVASIDRSKAVEAVGRCLETKPLAAAIVDALEAMGVIEFEDSSKKG